MLEFSNLIYKIALNEQARKSYKKRQLATATTDSNQRPATAAVADYASPQQVAIQDAQVGQTAGQEQRNKRTRGKKHDAEHHEEETAQQPAQKRKRVARAPQAQKVQAAPTTSNLLPATSTACEVIDLTTNSPPAPVPRQLQNPSLQQPINMPKTSITTNNNNIRGTRKTQPLETTAGNPASVNINIGYAGVEYQESGSHADLTTPPRRNVNRHSRTPNLPSCIGTTKTSTSGQLLGTESNGFMSSPSTPTFPQTPVQQVGGGSQIRSSPSPGGPLDWRLQRIWSPVEGNVMRNRVQQEQEQGSAALSPGREFLLQRQPMHQRTFNQPSLNGQDQASDIWTGIANGTTLSATTLLPMQSQARVQGQIHTSPQNLASPTGPVNHRLMENQYQYPYQMDQRNLATQAPQQGFLPCNAMVGQPQMPMHGFLPHLQNNAIPWSQTSASHQGFPHQQFF